MENIRIIFVGTGVLDGPSKHKNFLIFPYVELPMAFTSNIFLWYTDRRGRRSLQVMRYRGGVLSPICCDYRKIYSAKKPLTCLLRRPPAQVESTAFSQLWLKICRRHIFLTRRAPKVEILCGFNVVNFVGTGVPDGSS